MLGMPKAKAGGYSHKNITEKLKWKGLSLSAPKYKRYEFWLFHHQTTDSYVQRERECI